MNASAQLQEAQEKLARLDPNNRDHLAEIARLKAEIEQLNQVAQEEAAREQKTESYKGEYSDMLVIMFETLWPEHYKSVVGIEAYETMRQDYMRVHMAYNADQIERINADHATEIENWRTQVGDARNHIKNQSETIAEKDEEINRLSEAAEVNKKQAIQFREERDEAIDKFVKADTQLQELKDVKSENTTLQGRIRDLEAQLEQAQKPKEPAKTEALDNVINEIKSRKQMDPDELMRRWNSRQQGEKTIMKIDHLSKTVEVPEFPFRTPVDTQMVAPSPDPLPPVTQDQFRGSDGDLLQPSVLPPNGDGTAADTMGGANDETVSLTARIEALEADVAKLKRMNGMVA